MLWRLFLILLVLFGGILSAQRCPSFHSGRQAGRISVGVYALPAIHHFQGDEVSPGLPEQLALGYTLGADLMLRINEGFALMGGLATFKTRREVSALPYRGVHETQFLEAPFRAAFLFPGSKAISYLTPGFSLLWAKTLSGPSGRPVDEYTYHYTYLLLGMGMIRPLSERVSFLLEANFHYAFLLSDTQEDNAGYINGTSYLTYNQLYGVRVGVYFNLPGKRRY